MPPLIAQRALRAAMAASVMTSAALGSRVARAEAPPECVRAYVAAQDDRRAGRLRQAREDLLVCGGSSCPAALAADCADWLRDVERATPSFVVAVTGPDGSERNDAVVTVDHDVVAGALDGHAIAADPGPHDIRARLSGAGEGEVTMRFVLREGEHGRPVRLRFPPGAPLGPARPPKAASSRLPTASWVLGAAGVAALVGSAVVATSAFVGAPSLRTLGECKPSCSARDASEVHTKLLISDVGVAIAGAAIAAAVIVALTSRSGTAR